jgi:SAM-dependent methyltransferase
MNATAALGHRSSADEWFSTWFDSLHYRQLYVHRGGREAGVLIDKLIVRLRLADGATVLDLACGTGRHARHLAARGFDVTGLDLSAASIARASLHQGPRLRFRRHDMRVPFGVDAFDYVFNLFTSFGYFEDPAENFSVVESIARALKPGGILVLDYLNVQYAEAHLVPEDAIVHGPVAYRISRWTDATHIFKRIVIDEGGNRQPLEHTERIAKVGLADFRYMLTLYDMTIETTYGDYDLGPFVPPTSPRLILVARRDAGPRSRRVPPRELLADAADGLGCHAEV